MKTIVACLALVFAAALLPAQVAKPVPGRAAPAGKKGDAKEEEKEGKIDGQVLNRPDGRFLGLTLQDGKYKLTFYDKKKKPEKVDAIRATARWPNLHGPGDNRTVLNPAGDGTFLQGAQFVRGPHAFKLFLTLIKGEGDNPQAIESYTVDFRG